MEGKKRRKQSKKSKRSWRKHTDVEDVQEYLEDKQREEIVGVPAAEKTDEQLFSVDNEAASNDQTKHEGAELKASVRRTKRLLKTDMYLHPISAVDGFPARKRRLLKRYKEAKNIGGGSQMVEEKSDGMDADSSSDGEEYDKDTSYTVIRRQQLVALRTRMKEKPTKLPHRTVMRDLWSEDVQEDVDIPDEHYFRVTRKMAIKKPGTMKAKPSALENVQVPHPGMSYNPTFEDHQDLLRTALTVEEERERAAQKLEKKLQLAELTHQQREEVWLEEMTQGILDGAEERGEEEGEVEGGRSVVPKRPVRAEDRKTKKQRRKERARREQERLRRLEKFKKSSMDDVFRLRSIKREIVDQETKVTEKQKTREEEEKDSAFQTKRLGKYVYEEPDLELKLSSEIKGSLHSLKPEGSLAMDRYKSLQKRNMIEPRQFVKRRRKYRLKVKSKRSARLPEESQFK